MVNPFMVTITLLKISTIFALPGKGITGVGFNTSGVSIIVDFAPEPIIVKFLLIVSCSVYVSGNTFIVSPGFEAFIAAYIVGKSVGTVISTGLQNSTELTKKPSNGHVLHSYSYHPFGMC
jgi:hypothetical protein